MQKGAGILIKTLFIIYILMVLFFCFYQFSETPIDLGKYFLGIRMDRYAHAFMFFPYPFITWLTCRYSRTLSNARRYSLSITLLSGLVFAMATEILQDQIFLYRQGDRFDFLADAIGIVTGTIIVHFIGPWMVRVVESIFKVKKQNESKI